MVTDNTENESTSCQDKVLQPTTPTNRETTCDNANADVSSTNVAAAARLDTTNLKKQETSYSSLSHQTESKHRPQVPSYVPPDSRTLRDMLIRAKQLQDGSVPKGLRRNSNLAATNLEKTKVDNTGDLEKVLDSVTKRVEKLDADCNKHGKHRSLDSVEAEQCSSLSTPSTAAIKHQQLQDAAIKSTLTTSSHSPQPLDAGIKSTLTVSSHSPQLLVQPALAEDSVRRHYIKAAAADASLDTTDLKKQETSYLPVSGQTEAKHSPQVHSYVPPDSRTLNDMLIRAKQLQDGPVPKGLRRHSAATKEDLLCNLATTKVDNNGDLERVLDSVTKRVEKVDADCNKHGMHRSLDSVSNREPLESEQCPSLSTLSTVAMQHQHLQDAAIKSTLTALSHSPQPLVQPALAEDSVQRSPTLQETANRLTANVAANSLSQQDKVVKDYVSPEKSEDLMVAIPVEEDEVVVYAVSHDVSQHEVYKQVQRVRARRHSRQLYFCVFLLVAAAVMIASIVVIKTNNNDGQEQQAETEMTTSQNMTQLIMSIMGADAVLLNDASSSYAKALTWLLQSNERNKSQEMTNTLAQRFYAASFYFDTTTDDDKWTDCNPPNSSSDDQTCHDSYSNSTAQAWLSDSHECDWAGVKCDYHQQIRRLVLQDMNLVGTIPSSITKFPFLSYLWIKSSRLEGNISLLFDCHHFITIYLDNTLLSGDLSVVWQHRKLQGFSVVNNRYTGNLSSQIGNLVDLHGLYMYGNELTGTVPSEVGWLDSIVDFDIGNNQFRGKLPLSMQLWSKILTIDVGGNSFTGSFPTFLGQRNKTLVALGLSDNSFTGTLPDELFHLSELIALDVSNNELSGTLDARFAQLTSSQLNTTLGYLYLSSNHFSGTIPTELGLLTDLHELDLQGNKLIGSVPASLCQNQFLYSEFELVADCAKDDNGQVELQCDCCTSCCQADGTQCGPP